LEREGSIFQTTSDTEVILHLMARNPRGTLVDTLVEALLELRGAYSLLLLSDQALIAVRDPYGIRPLALGEHPEGACFASESCAFDLMEAKMVRELDHGEVVVARDGAIVERHRLPTQVQPARCAFEHVYFARPDSKVFGDSVARVRQEMGAQLAREAP